MTKICLICLLLGVGIGQLFLKNTLVIRLLIGLGIGVLLAVLVIAAFVMGGDK